MAGEIKSSQLFFNPVPYMTPWMFLPAYIEVDYNTCSVVLLRSPLQQANEVEIPSPFPPRWHQLVYEWYSTLRRLDKKIAKQQLAINGNAVHLKPKFDRWVIFFWFNLYRLGIMLRGLSLNLGVKSRKS
jgi:hypothetical protein